MAALGAVPMGGGGRDEELAEGALLRGKRLTAWTVKLAAGGEVCVEGSLVNDGRYWHSTPISRALKPDLLQTASGSLYLLEGPIDRAASAKLGLPAPLVAQFTGGFPEDWRELLQAHLRAATASRNTTSVRWFEDATAGQAAPASSFAVSSLHAPPRLRNSLAPHHLPPDTNKPNLPSRPLSKPAAKGPSRIPKAPHIAAQDKENTPSASAKARRSSKRIADSPARCHSPEPAAQRNETATVNEKVAEEASTQPAEPPKEVEAESTEPPAEDTAGVEEVAAPEEETGPVDEEEDVPAPAKATPKRRGRKSVLSKTLPRARTPASAPPKVRVTRSSAKALRHRNVARPASPATPAPQEPVPDDPPPSDIGASPRLATRRSPRASKPLEAPTAEQTATEALARAKLTATEEVVETLATVPDETAEKPIEERGSAGGEARRSTSAAVEKPSEPAPQVEEAAEEAADEVETAEEPANEAEEAPEEVPPDCRVLLSWEVKAGMEGEVCVEGLLEDGNVWHTSPISRALSPRLVVTHSGSRYFLRGEMGSSEDGLLSPALRDVFRDGFPGDWKGLLFDDVVRTLKDRNARRLKWMAEFQRRQGPQGPHGHQLPLPALHGGGDVDEGDDGDDGGGEDYDPMPIVEMPPSDTEEGRESSVGPRKEEQPARPLPNMPNIVNISAQPMPAPKPPAPASPKTPAIALADWSLRLMKHSVVHVEGRMSGNAKRWASSKIASALAADIVETHSGSRYKLVGRQNVERSVERNGFPQHLAEPFLDGFPRNWRKLVKKHHQSQTNGTHASQSSHVVGDTLQSGFLHTSVASQRQHSAHPPMRQRTAGGLSPSSFKVPAPKKPAQKKKAAAVKPRVSDVPEEESDGERRRSRSGRRLLQPLASWAGERIVYSVEGRVVEEARVSEVDRSISPPSQRRPSKAKPKKRRVVVEEESDEGEPSPPKAAKMGPPKKAPPVRWSNQDLRWLKVGLNATRPAMEDMEAWRNVGMSVGGAVSNLPPEEVRRKAVEVWGYELELENDREQLSVRAEAEARLAAERRAAGRSRTDPLSAASLAASRRFAETSARSSDHNVSADDFDASVLPSGRARAPLLTSLAELSESDLSDALTPPRGAAAFRSERRFIPQPRRASVASPASSVDTRSPRRSTADDSPLALRHTAAFNRFHKYRRGPKGQGRKGSGTAHSAKALNDSTAAERTAGLSHSRVQMLAQARTVERQLHSLRQDDDDDEHYEDDTE